jgi:hypothetical protein
MGNCECMSGCPFFNDKMNNMPAMADMYKKKYCQTDYAGCARYMVMKKLGKPAVPADLFPNQKQRALEILG